MFKVLVITFEHKCFPIWYIHIIIIAKLGCVDWVVLAGFYVCSTNFTDESFQAINCIATDNQNQKQNNACNKNTKNTRTKIY